MLLNFRSLPNGLPGYATNNIVHVIKSEVIPIYIYIYIYIYIEREREREIDM